MFLPSRAATVAVVGGLLSLTACSGGDPDQEAPPEDPRAALTATMLPPIVQVGPEPAPADDAGSVVAARLASAEEGVSLTLERESGSEWKEVATATTGAAGTADFVLEKPGDTAYRVSGAEIGPVPVDTEPWEVHMSDEFKGTTLSEQWYHRGGDYNPAGLRACSKGSPGAAQVAGGVLNLRTQLDPARAGEQCRAKAADGDSLGAFDYRLNGHVATTKSFQYGVTSARIKFQELRGQHGSFWLQSLMNAATQTDPATGGAEIDVVEYFGEGNNDKLASFIYYPTPDGVTKEGDFIEEAHRFLADQDDDWWKRFHVFTLEWTEDEYVIRIDGQEAWRTDQGVSQVPESVILSLLSSDYELPKLKDGGDLPQTMQVDWVRHWARP